MAGLEVSRHEAVQRVCVACSGRILVIVEHQPNRRIETMLSPGLGVVSWSGGLDPLGRGSVGRGRGCVSVSVSVRVYVREGRRKKGLG